MAVAPFALNYNHLNVLHFNIVMYFFIMSVLPPHFLMYIAFLISSIKSIWRTPQIIAM